jgi:flagellar basal body-associated protein FliL
VITKMNKLRWVLIVLFTVVLMLGSFILFPSFYADIIFNTGGTPREEVSNMTSLSKIIEAYKTKHGIYPDFNSNQLEDLVRVNNINEKQAVNTTDHWGNSYVFQYIESDSELQLRILSLGKNKVFNNGMPDDICFFVEDLGR